MIDSLKIEARNLRNPSSHGRRAGFGFFQKSQSTATKTTEIKGNLAIFQKTKQHPDFQMTQDVSLVMRIEQNQSISPPPSSDPLPLLQRSSVS